MRRTNAVSPRFVLMLDVDDTPFDVAPPEGRPRTSGVNRDSARRVAFFSSPPVHRTSQRFTERYRNRRRRFGLRFNLIARLYNHGLTLPTT